MQAKLVLLLSALSSAMVLFTLPSPSAADLFVGESFTRTCGGNAAVYWWLNGKLTNVTGNLYRVDNATVDQNGTLKCTSSDPKRYLEYVTLEIRMYSLLGVSPSPCNCSSVDNTTNTCTVPAAVGSPLTLCADFIHYPIDATHFNPNVTSTGWKMGSEVWMWICYYTSASRCDNFSSHFPSTVSGNWGQCIHLDSITQNSTFNYVINVNPSKEYPAHFRRKVMKSAFFHVQAAAPTSARASSHHVLPTSTIMASRAMPTSTIMPTDLMPTSLIGVPEITTETAVPVTVAVIAVIVFVSILVIPILLWYKRRGRKSLRKRPCDGNVCIIPEIQTIATSDSCPDGGMKRMPPTSLPLPRRYSSSTNLLPKSPDNTPNTVVESLNSGTPTPPSDKIESIYNALDKTLPPPPPPYPPSPLPCTLDPQWNCPFDYECRSVKSMDFGGEFGPERTV